MANNNKKQNQEDDLFDSDQACKYIMKNLPPHVASKVSEDDVLYVLDLEDEYFESKGYFDDNAPETVEIDEDEEFDFICEKVEADKQMAHLTSDIISVILDKNYDYCEETGIFDDDQD